MRVDGICLRVQYSPHRPIYIQFLEEINFPESFLGYEPEFEPPTIRTRTATLDCVAPSTSVPEFQSTTITTGSLTTLDHDATTSMSDPEFECTTVRTGSTTMFDHDTSVSQPPSPAETVDLEQEDEDLQAAIRASLEAPQVLSHQTPTLDELLRPTRRALAEAPYNAIINLQRERISESLLFHIKRPQFDLNKKIKVKFITPDNNEEDGVDFGGPLKEAFYLAVEEIKRSRIFIGPENNKFILRNSLALANNDYFNIGLLLGLARKAGLLLGLA